MHKQDYIDSGLLNFKISTFFILSIASLFFVFGVLNTLGLDKNAVVFFEGVLLLYFLFVFIKYRIDKNILYMILIVLSYIFFSYIYISFFGNHNFLDFFVIYKFLFYIFVISFFYNKNFFEINYITYLYKFLISCFFIFYFFQKILIGVNRPEVVGENNYELVLLCLIYFIVNLTSKKIDYFFLGLLAIVIFLGGSRSAAAIFLFGSLILFMSNILTIKNLILLLFLMISAFGFYYVFMERLNDGLENIDRFKMFEMFLYSIKDWGVLNWLFGAERISTLPPAVCSSLSFYENLFSYSGNGSCYSVILHAFNMRIIYDHGLILTLGVFFYLWHFLGDKTNLKVKIFVLGTIFLTGMSVSALNNVYVAMGLIIASSLYVRNIND